MRKLYEYPRPIICNIQVPQLNDNIDAANLGIVSTEKQLQGTANGNDNAIANRKSSAFGRVEIAQERSMTLKADKSGSLNSSFYQEDRNNQPILETLL